uniref:NADH-ubiquinone oxidoreductase chain 6 n=1 Tax=Arge similis TaxID=621222 RepID=A0A3S8V0A2_9HYME|nr:NADH dehydrogenase subunit 6 [Arge similis]
MIYMMIIMMMILNMTFCFFKHPMMLGMNLLIQTIMLIMLLGSMNKTFWFSYIMFLIMIGALIVLFIYMTSITSNKKFKFNNMNILMIILLMIIMMMLYFKIDQMIMFMKIIMEESINLNNEINNNNNNQESLMMSSMYNQLEKLITFILINYLLYVLFIIVKIIDIKKGMMRKSNN